MCHKHAVLISINSLFITMKSQQRKLCFGDSFAWVSRALTAYGKRRLVMTKWDIKSYLRKRILFECGGKLSIRLKQQFQESETLSHLKRICSNFTIMKYQLVSYRENVLKPHLYTCIEWIQGLTGIPITYLVENNALSHQSAQRVDSPECSLSGIMTFDWPSKSPDLKQIEPIWSDAKDEISTYQFTVASMTSIRQHKQVLVPV